MISHGKDLKIFSGNSNRALAEAICKELRLPLGDLECGHFSDGECFVSIYETVRGLSVNAMAKIESTIMIPPIIAQKKKRIPYLCKNLPII